MRTSTLIFCLFAILCVVPALSQDKIYLSSDTKNGKIVEITSTYVSYQPNPEKKKTVNIPNRKVLLVFNEKGGYLVLSKLDFKQRSWKQAIASFLDQETVVWTTDRVYKSDQSVEEGKVMKEDDSGVQLAISNMQKTIPEKLVSVVIYRDGRHSVHGSASAAADVLTGTTGSFAGINPSEKQKLSEPNKVASAFETGTKTASGPSDSSSAPTVEKQAAVEQMLNDVSRKDFEERVLQKTELFGRNLKYVSDKSKPADEVNKVIDLTVDLFVNENAIVESSSLNRTMVRKRKIRDYLVELKKLPYSRVELEWYDVQYFSKLELGTDGNYYGTVEFLQKFKAYKDNQIVYQDLTKKRSKVVVKKYSKIVAGQQQTAWDILLGDVGVSSTQKIVEN